MKHKSPRQVEPDVGKAGRVGLTCNVGKHWVLTNGLTTYPGKAANYGWHDASAPNIAADGNTPLWQSQVFAHNLAHVEYEQNGSLSARIAQRLWFIVESAHESPRQEPDADLCEEPPYVCPGCHTVGGGPCLPGCVDAEIEEERLAHEDDDPCDDCGGKDDECDDCWRR